MRIIVPDERSQIETDARTSFIHRLNVWSEGTFLLNEAVADRWWPTTRVEREPYVK